MILGIDGGGSKTQFLLVDREGRVLSRYQCGTCHHMQIGFDAVRKLILEGVAKVLSAGRGLNEVDFAAIGLPGLGESRQAETTLNTMLLDMFPCRFEAVNDVKLAWAGAHGCQPGVCVLAGTGSMAYAVDEDGQNLRCGGWGEPFSDEGSGYWMGARLCALYSRMADGREEKGLLYRLLKEQLQLEDDFMLIDRIHGAEDQRRFIAGLAPLLVQAGQRGDQQAMAVLRQAAGELADLVRGLLPSFGGARPVRVSYQGGVFRSGAFFCTLLEQALRPLPVALFPPLFSPVEGACLYAANQLKIDGQGFRSMLAGGRALAG